MRSSVGSGTEVTTIPEWVDWDQIERGQKVFYRYGGPVVLSLTFVSLMGGMGGRRVVETLTRTGGFGTSVARRRLLETFQHILQVTQSLESVQPGGEGFASSLRVRFLHAQVRRRILSLARSKAEYYSVDDLGVPISDLDCIATISTFGAAIIWVGLPRQGIYLRQQEVHDYLALWRWVAHLLGTPTDFFSTPEKAKAIMESLAISEIAPSANSRILANNLITSLQDQPPARVSREFLCAEARWLNGWELADALAISRPPPLYTLLVFFQCLLLMCVCYVYRAVPAWDERNIQKYRAMFKKIKPANQDSSATKSLFEFQYLPSLAFTSTPAGPQPPPPSPSTTGALPRRRHREG